MATSHEAVSPRVARKAERIQRTLDRVYPDPPRTFLPAPNPYAILIKVLLSAQSTDVRVNKHAPEIFSRFGSNPGDLLKAASQQELEDVIRPIGLAPRKSRNILQLSEILLDQFQGKVPDTLEELETLPGVGHKTASVVLLHAFGKPAFPVDTHIHRLACRWGAGDAKSVDRTEATLKKWFPDAGLWGRLHIQLILFGREYCPARRHDMSTCPICSWAATDEARSLNSKSPNKFAAAPKHQDPGSMREGVWEEHKNPISRQLSLSMDSDRVAVAGQGVGAHSQSPGQPQTGRAGKRSATKAENLTGDPAGQRKVPTRRSRRLRGDEAPGTD